MNHRRTHTGSPSVVLDVREGTAEIVLTREAKRNAIDYAMVDTMMEFLDLLEAEDEVRCVILTGAGKEAFSAGADIPCFAKSVEAGIEVALKEFVERGQGLTRRIEEFSKPVIAAVNGFAYGAGCEIVEACHIAVASPIARFAKPEIKLGFPPPFGGTQRLPRLIGKKRALQLILTAEPISAEAAARIGLINEVVPNDRLIERAREIAMLISRRPAVAVSACLSSVTQGVEVSTREGLTIEATQFSRAAGSPDVQERLRAFSAPGRPQSERL